MSRRVTSIAILCAMGVAGPAFAADPLCDHLHAFTHASFDIATDGKPSGRWIELHWLGAWLDLNKGWRIECRDSGDAASKALCAWLPRNVSFEFSNITPLEIMGCYGYRYPHPYPQWYPILIGMPLWDKAKDDRSIELEADFRDRESPENAIRISVAPSGLHRGGDQHQLIVDNPLKAN